MSFSSFRAAFTFASLVVAGDRTDEVSTATRHRNL